MDIWKIVLLCLAGAFVLFGFLPTFLIAERVYHVTLVRETRKKWGRECSSDDPEQIAMYGKGIAWAEQYQAVKTPCTVKSGRLTLAGEYFDFGGDKACIVIPGRTESLYYSYYFSEPYRACGFNVLVIDNRCHGLSQGRYNSVGHREQYDLLAWARLLHDRFGNKQVIYHGICIGSATACYAVNNPACPEYVAGMVADGMYKNFYETFKNHMIEDKRMLFPVLQEVVALIWLHTGSRCVSDGPYRYMEAMKKPILFLYTDKDLFSLPEESKKLFAACGSPEKEIVWFHKGGHSHIRINNEETYDAAIREYVRKHFA